MTYLSIKYFHVGCVVLSGALFALRGVWMLNESTLLGARAVRVVPHIIDSFLLLSAGVLCVLSQQFPLVDTWLTLKLALLLVYIVLGMYALHWGKTRTSRRTYWCAALAVFAAIVIIAIEKPASVEAVTLHVQHGFSLPPASCLVQVTSLGSKKLEVSNHEKANTIGYGLGADARHDNPHHAGAGRPLES